MDQQINAQLKVIDANQAQIDDQFQTTQAAINAEKQTLLQRLQELQHLQDKFKNVDSLNLV